LAILPTYASTGCELAFEALAALHPVRFMRVHRSAIVRLDLVELLHRGAGGDYEVQLKGGARLRVSRSRHEMLERWLGLAK
jgi:two-component system, LytTR family, response regulator